MPFALLLAVSFAPADSPASSAAAGVPDFTRDVRPILSNRCFRCHGPDGGERATELRLDSGDALTADLGGYAAVVPGDVGHSELLNRVTAEDEYTVMPPPDTGPPLTAAEVDVLRRWIAAGAAWEGHWAWRAPVRPAIPAVRGTRDEGRGLRRTFPHSRHSTLVPRPSSPAEPPRNPVDAFVRARLDDERLSPNPPAGRAILLRRVSLALTGLPPTVGQVDAFLADDRADAYERRVDRLLATPAFGERWAAVWLDLARYADSAGYAQDPPRTIWAYRDWVIDALNRNQPYDEFTRDQLAGDLLPDPTEDQLVATAFHRNTMTNSEGGTDDEEFRSAAVVDRVNTTVQVWTGVTMGCAQCHTHKYDPVTHADYFRFYAIFNQTADADRTDELPVLKLLTDAERAERDRLAAELAALGGRKGTGKKKSAEAKKLAARVKSVGTSVPVMRAVAEKNRRETFIHLRGDHRSPGERVEPGLPSAFPPLPAGYEPDRLGVAAWLTDESHPLTARVAVNRFWERLFGTGIVESSGDFGIQGEPPSHPALLDWLAVEFRESGWDVKRLLRLIVTSATYRQDSRVPDGMAERDPRNRLLARGPRFRLPAETIRDAALHNAGLLSATMHGPSVRPFRPNLGLKSAFGGSTDWEPSPGGDRHRRGLYTEWRRTTPYPSMTTFDATSREVCTLQRIRTNTPLQALVTLNDPVFVEAAKNLAERVRAGAGGGRRAGHAAVPPRPVAAPLGRRAGPADDAGRRTAGALRRRPGLGERIHRRGVGRRDGPGRVGGHGQRGVEPGRNAQPAVRVGLIHHVPRSAVADRRRAERVDPATDGAPPVGDGWRGGLPGGTRG